jgi:hypothetical protein
MIVDCWSFFPLFYPHFEKWNVVIEKEVINFMENGM